MAVDSIRTIPKLVFEKNVSRVKTGTAHHNFLSLRNLRKKTSVRVKKSRAIISSMASEAER